MADTKESMVEEDFDFDDEFDEDFGEDDEFGDDFEEDEGEDDVDDGEEEPGDEDFDNSMSTMSLRSIRITRSFSKTELKTMRLTGEKFKRAEKILDKKVMTKTSEYTLFTNFPRTQYEIFLSNKNIRQVSVQVPPENEKSSVHVETDPIFFEEKTLQVPEELYGLPVEQLSKAAGGKKKASEVNTQNVLRMFKQSFGFIDLILSEGRKNEEGEMKGFVACDQFKFGNSFISIRTPEFLKGRSIVKCSFDISNKFNIILCYSATAVKGDDLLNDNGVIVIWNFQLNSAEKILVSHGQLTCFCQVPSRPNIIIGGTIDGAVLLWDTNEYENFHPPIKLSKQRVCKRFPSYSTDWKVEENHRFPVVDVLSIGYKTGEKNNQFISVDQFGEIIFWLISVSVISEGKKEDLGLRMNSVVRVVRSNSLPLDSRVHSIENEVKNSANFIVGTTDGKILRKNRFNHPILPSVYLKKNFSSKNIINTIEYSALLPVFFLCGSSDGAVSLYSTKYDNPIFVFSGFTNFNIIDVKWSNTNPGQFFVLDSNSHLFVFDLGNKANMIIYKENVIRSTRSTGKYIKASGIAVPSLFSKIINPQDESEKKRNFVLINYIDGNVDIHTLIIRPPEDIEKEKIRVNEAIHALFL